MTAPTGRAPRYKNKGQRRRAIPADELAGKYVAAQPSAPPTREWTLVAEGETLERGKEKEKKNPHVWAPQWETYNDDGADKTQSLGAETQKPLIMTRS